MNDKTYEFTKYAENIAIGFKNDYKKLPRETALVKYEKIKKYKGSSRYPHSMMDLFNNCGFQDVPLPHKLKEKDILAYLNSLPTKDEVTEKLMVDLYSIYNDYKSPGQYMERLVNLLADDEFAADTTRLKILKQFVKYIQKDGESVHSGIHSFIKDIKKSFADIKNSKNVSDILNKLDDSIFLNTNLVLSLDDSQKDLAKRFLNDVIGSIDTSSLSDDNAKTYSSVQSVLKKLNLKNYITSGEVSVIKSADNFIYIPGQECEVIKKLAKKLDILKNAKGNLSSKQILVLSRLNDLSQDVPFYENRADYIDFTLMFKSVGASDGESYTDLKNEQLNLLKKAINFVNKNIDLIPLSDKKARIKFVNEEFLGLSGSICSEHLLNEIKILAGSVYGKVNLAGKEFLDSLCAFLTDRINVNKEEMHLIDSLYEICQKTVLKNHLQNIYDEFADMISHNTCSQNNTIKLTQSSKELLKIAEDLATCTFRMNGATRESLYLFAFAFDLKPSKSDDPFFNSFKDLEKFFWDCYNDSVFRHLEVNDFIDNSSLPTGEGINYKNFAEVICMYFLSKEDTEYSKYEKYKSAIECINNCKIKAQHSHNSNDTLFYKTVYWDEVLKISSKAQLEEFICKNFYVPKSAGSSCNVEVLRNTGINKDELEAVTNLKIPDCDSVRLTILKRFIEYGFVGDGPITGVSSFVKKSVENNFDGITDKSEVFSKITDDSIDAFRVLNIKDEYKLLSRISTNLASGDFVKYSSAKENLFKFAFVFDMKIYQDKNVAGYSQSRDAEILFKKFFADGINFNSKLDTICAYYLANSEFPLNKKLNTVQYRLKQAFGLYRNPCYDLADTKIIEDKKSYFWSTAVFMDEESFRDYVLTQFASGINVNINNFDAFSDEVTAYETYKSIINEFELVFEEQDIRSTLLDDIQIMRSWLRDTYPSVDKEFLHMLGGIENMVSSVKNITKKNITRNDLIILNYHKITEELFQDRDLEYVYDYAIDYINFDLEKCRYQPLNPKNFFDLFIICLLYMHSIDTPLF